MLQIYEKKEKVYEYQMRYHFALSYPLLSLNTDVKLVNKDGEILGADEILTLRTNRKLNEESMEYGKEVSTSNSNLVLTTAEIHPAPNVGYAKNVE